MSTVKLTVRLPEALHRVLRQEARDRDRSLNATLVDLLWQGLDSKRANDEPSERARVERILRESGLLAEWGPYWDKYIEAAKDVTIEEIREMWRGKRPLSEDIIAGRGER